MRSLSTRRLVMTWECPSFVEIEMNAEVGSYQEDFDGQDERRDY